MLTRHDQGAPTLFLRALSLAVLSTIIVWEIFAIAANFTSRFANELRSHREQGHR